MEINLSYEQLDVFLAALELVVAIWLPIWVANELKK